MLKSMNRSIRFAPVVWLFADSIPNFQNTTIEERVSLLEIQVADIEGQITDLDQDVNFLFDETVIQDERIFSLEQRFIEVDEEVEGKDLFYFLYLLWTLAQIILNI